MTTRQRVAIVIAQTADGSSTVALRGAMALDPARFAVTLIGGTFGVLTKPHTAGALTGADAIKGAPGHDLLACAHEAGMEVIRVPELGAKFAPRRDTTAMRSLATLYRSGGFDAVHTYGTKAGLLGRVVAVRTDVPRIVHTITAFRQQAAWRRRGVGVAIERRLGRHTDMLIAVGSSVAAEVVRRRLIKPERIWTMLPNASFATAPHGAGARGRARCLLGLPTGVRVVGTAGPIDVGQAPEEWVRALATVACGPGGEDVWGVWIGDGPLRGKLQARARAHGIADRLRVISCDADLAELLPAFDLFALASRRMAPRHVLIDAVAARVPIVATTDASVEDLVVPGITGLLVPPGRPDQLGQGVRHLLEDSDAAQRMRANAYTVCAQRYRSVSLGDELARIYDGRA